MRRSREEISATRSELRDKKRQLQLSELDRKERYGFLVKAFLFYQDDVEALKAALPEGELAAKIAKDAWFGRKFDKPASLILEEGLVLSLIDKSLQNNSGALAALKVALPALNKKRWNLGVQKQETANEGMADYLKIASEKPMTRQDLQAILILSDPKLVMMNPSDLKMLTLDEAAREDSERKAIDVTPEIINNIQEDEDLRDR